jgi:hypothetical protein
VREGKVTTLHARDAYGVVLDPVGLRVDGEATLRLRRAMRERDAAS